MTDEPTQHINGETSEARILARLDAMETRINDRFTGVESRLSALEAQAEDRARETRPIWEKALAEILALGEQLKETNLHLDEMNEKFEIIGGELLSLKGKQKHLETRLRAVEGDPQTQ